jgi:beta-glucosidase
MMNNEKVIKQLSLIEKAILMSGKDIFSTMGFDSHGIPSLSLADGPHGLRKQLGSADHLGLAESMKATCFPTAAAIANSWDETLVEEVGSAIGDEAIVQGVNVVLGPGLNIKRNPLCGRNFEYYSEDPYLAGKMAAALTKGIQSKGVSACPKHYAVNNQELRRLSNDSVLDERTLREIYLTNFEIAIKEGNPLFLMTSYNRVNGQYANEHEHLLSKILYQEWGYNGAVVTDWGGSNDHVEGVRHGSHLEMPSTKMSGAMEIVEAVKSGKLDEDLLDQRVDELLTVTFKLKGNSTSEELTDEMVQKHHEIAKKAARSSIVLLKNENAILPIEPDVKVAIVGDFAQKPRYQGAGSSEVNPTKIDSILSVIGDYPIKKSSYSQGYERGKKTNNVLVNEAVQNAKEADIVIVFAGLDEISEVEGAERQTINMPEAQNHLIEKLAEVTPNIIVVISSGSVIKMPWQDKVAGILHGYLGGQAGAGAMLDVIVGNYNPSGKLNESYPLAYEDVPNLNYYPGKEKTSEYREGIFVGYRYYETADVAVNYPFGFGLSYTTFDYSDLVIEENHTLSFTLKNTGHVDGEEISQVYMQAPGKFVFRAKKELVGFTKTSLKAGEEKRVSIKINERAFQYFNVKTDQWETEAGTHKLLVSTNVSDVKLIGEIEVEASTNQQPYLLDIMSNYVTGLVQNIPDAEFKALLNTEIPNSKWDTSKPLDVNDTFSQLYYAKSFLARVAYKVINGKKEKSERAGKPDLNILYVYNMPFRGMSKMLGGHVNMEMVDAMMIIINGKFWSGLVKLLKAYRKNRKVIKEGKVYYG